MISVVYNEVNQSIDIFLDAKGAELLIGKLQDLKSGAGHAHLYPTDDDQGVSMTSPYKEAKVYSELVLTMLPSEAWEDAAGSK
jgi:hypothetical protein